MLGGTLDGKGHPGSHITKHFSLCLLRHTGKAKHLMQSKMHGLRVRLQESLSLLRASDTQLQPASGTPATHQASQTVTIHMQKCMNKRLLNILLLYGRL